MGLILERKVGESLLIKTTQGNLLITPVVVGKNRIKIDLIGPREIQVERVNDPRYENIREENQFRIDSEKEFNRNA